MVEDIASINKVIIDKYIILYFYNNDFKIQNVFYLYKIYKHYTLIPKEGKEEMYFCDLLPSLLFCCLLRYIYLIFFL